MLMLMVSRTKQIEKIVDGDGSDENTLDLEIAGGICPSAKLVMYFGRILKKDSMIPLIMPSMIKSINQRLFRSRGEHLKVSSPVPQH